MLKIRLANETDIKKVFDLSNDDVVRQNSLNKEKIEWENHVKWFKKRIEKKDEPFYIIEKEGNFLGQVRFDKKEDGVYISLSIMPEFRGKGYASYLIKECSKKSGFSKIYSTVKEDNTPSFRAFLKSGFEHIANKDGFKTLILNTDKTN